jgi:hypothetical protein
MRLQVIFLATILSSSLLGQVSRRNLRFYPVSSYMGDNSRIVFISEGNYIENQYKNNVNVSHKLDLVLKKLSLLDFQLQPNLLLKEIQIANSNTKDLKAYNKILQQKIDSLIHLSKNKNELFNSDEYNRFENHIIETSYLSESFNVSKDENGSLYLNLTRNEKSKNIVFESDLKENRAPFFKYNCWGYTNERGQEIIPCSYQKALWFNDGLAPVLKNEMWLYIDKNGEKRLTTDGLKVSLALPFYDGRALLILTEKDSYFPKKKAVVIDKSGKRLRSLKLRSDEDVVWSNGRFHILKWYETNYDGSSNIHYTLINNNLEKILDDYSVIEGYDNGVLLVNNSKYYGYFNCITGEEIISQKYVRASVFVNGLAMVENQDKRKSIINLNDAAIIPFGKFRIKRVSKSRFEVKKMGLLNKTHFTINEEGKCIYGDCFWFREWKRKHNY